MESLPTITILAFRRVERSGESEARWGMEQHLVNLVILDYGASEQEKKKLKEVEAWARQRSEDIRLSKILKSEAFTQTYREMIRSPLKTFFLTCLSIHEIPNEPLQQFYQQFPNQQIALKQIHRQAEENLKKISFIILKDNLEKIDKRNYFHANIALVTSQTQMVKDVLEENLAVIIKLRPNHSTSSVNSEQVHQYGEALELIPKEIKIRSKDHEQIEKDNDYEAIKILNNTPGVGTYNIQGYRK